jgi:hypothetical protein
MKKNSGITCNSHVTRNNPWVMPIGFDACGPSFSHSKIVNTQCQATTTSKLNARTKSIKTSRSPMSTVGWEGAGVLTSQGYDSARLHRRL